MTKFWPNWTPNQPKIGSFFPQFLAPHFSREMSRKTISRSREKCKKCASLLEKYLLGCNSSHFESNWKKVFVRNVSNFYSPNFLLKNTHYQYGVYYMILYNLPKRKISGSGMVASLKSCICVRTALIHKKHH